MKKYIILPAISLLGLLVFPSTAQNKENKKAPSEESKPQLKMQYVLHKADSRGETRAGWLLGKHTFSFNNYYDPERMNFGVLRVLNDDRINPGAGFGTHPHENMEIITIPLSGAVEHKDNMGNKGVIKAGDVQMMSAGTGITHSEVNHSSKDTLRLLQIWVLPDKHNVKPRYQQLNGILHNTPVNTFKKLVAPDDSTALFLYSNTVFSMGEISAGKDISYNVAFKGNGVYAFILEGSAVVNGISVSRRDGIGMVNIERLNIKATTGCRILLMDVPMID